MMFYIAFDAGGGCLMAVSQVRLFWMHSRWLSIIGAIQYVFLARYSSIHSLRQIKSHI